MQTAEQCMCKMATEGDGRGRSLVPCDGIVKVDKRPSTLDTMFLKAPTHLLCGFPPQQSWGEGLDIVMYFSRGSVAPLLQICQLSVTKCQRSWDFRVLASCCKCYK